MVSRLACSRVNTFSCSVERELADVEKVLVSVAKRLDEGMYPQDQVCSIIIITTDPPPIIVSRSWVYSSSR